MRQISQVMLPILFTLLLAQAAEAKLACAASETATQDVRLDQWQGFWLGQSIGNWTGLVTEMDKIGGEGEHGRFYTRDDWGKPDQPAIWSETPSDISSHIDFVLRGAEEVWGADDDTDIEYMYLWTMHHQGLEKLSPSHTKHQARDRYPKSSESIKLDPEHQRQTKALCNTR